jgi:hypothetical protein
MLDAKLEEDIANKNAERNEDGSIQIINYEESQSVQLYGYLKTVDSEQIDLSSYDFLER